jgi:hypothetical protein
MKQLILFVTILLGSSMVVLGQAGHAGQENSLRGLKGVRLVAMFARADAIEDAKRAEILKAVEADAKAKLVKAGIPLLTYTNEMEEAGSPTLTVMITCDKMNGFVYPIVAEIKLRQRVRLTRDPSIEAELDTWRQHGIGGPELTMEMLHKMSNQLVDQFVTAYASVNPK